MDGPTVTSKRAAGRGRFEADRALARTAADGDREALREVLRRITRKLRAIAWHMCRDHHHAEDLCQEALVKITSPRVLGQYRAEGPLDGYLVGVGVRAMISARRTRRMHDWDRITPVDALSEDPGSSPDPTSAISTINPALYDALMALPERARLIVLLITVGGYSYSETAELLGMPVGTVKSAYSRARCALRTQLSHQPL